MMRFAPKSPLLFAAFTLALLGLLASSALARESAGPGTTVVKQANESIRELLRKEVPSGSPQEKKLAGQVTEAVRGFLDVGELGRRALRDHWDDLSEEQRQQYSTLLRDLIERNYIKGLRANLAYEVEYTGESSRQEELVVTTEIKSERNGRPYTVHVDYLLRKEEESWRAYDVITDGVGLVENYRAQFNRIIARDGFPGLIKLMEKRKNELDS